VLKSDGSAVDGVGVRRVWVCAVLASAGYLGLVGASDPAYSAFSASTANGANALVAGTVTISDSSPGTALYTVSNTKPGDVASACTIVRYTGSVPASVRSYASTTGDLAAYLDLTVTRGTATDTSGGNCATFTADPGGGVLYSGTLAGYPAGWSSGVVDPAGTWTTGQTHSYRITVAVQDVAAAQGKNATTTFSWEARG